MSSYEIETISERPPRFKLRPLLAGAATVLVTGGFLTVLLAEVMQVPVAQP